MDRIDKIIRFLKGTCRTLDEACEVFIGEESSSADLSLEEINKLDDEIFLCEVCSWWCEISEMADEEDTTCLDCYV